jgi:hypothetical protein
LEGRNFCLAYFPQFWRKYWFLKINAMIKFLQKLAVIRAKNANFFAKNFGENILKIITSVPGY